VLDRSRPDVFARYQVLFPNLETYSRGFAAYVNKLKSAVR